MRAKRLTIWQQVLSMNREWPNFRILSHAKHQVFWEGKLCPLNKTYTVRVALVANGCQGKGYRAAPFVIVSNPILRTRSSACEQTIPHIYKNDRDPKCPFLCLYDPAKSEWNSTLKVARTIVPWTIDWLVCYEGWLATGEWTGGGRHPILS